MTAHYLAAKTKLKLLAVATYISLTRGEAKLRRMMALMHMSSVTSEY